MKYVKTFEQFIESKAILEAMTPEEKKARRKARRAAKKNGTKVAPISKSNGKTKDSGKSDFDKLVEILTKKKVPCKVELRGTDIDVLCGWNYPNRIANKIWDAAEKIGLNPDDISVSAEMSGGTIDKSQRIAGGPKRY